MKNMTIRNPRSIIIIFVFIILNFIILGFSWVGKPEVEIVSNGPKSVAPEYTLIDQLEYFHLKNTSPLLSLTADQMRSQGEEVAEFDGPKGLYYFKENSNPLHYESEKALYEKAKSTLTFNGSVTLVTDEAKYEAKKLRYHFPSDLLKAWGDIQFNADDLKTMDHVTITADRMSAHPKQQSSHFEGSVQGEIKRRRQYEGKTNFRSRELDFEQKKSQASLLGEVMVKRGNYLLTAGKADMFLENYNNSLKYFVMNDDVKLREKLQTSAGLTVERKAFAERLEGFGREQKMVLSGAPRVEQGEDVIKGYRITIRENAELIEVDDAMSDMQMQKKKKN